jgi:hypothetical protein
VQASIQLRRRRLPPAVLGAALLSAATSFAATDAAARWEGVADVAGQPMRLIVDLGRDAHGAWVGSAILPGRGVKGAALDALAVADGHVSFGLAAAFAAAPVQSPRVVLDGQPDGALSGHLSIGGQTADVLLRRSGAAQVDLPPASTPISARLEGRWHGGYELGGTPRDVTLTLTNGTRPGATGQLVIVGKRTTRLDVDLVVQGREFITLRSIAADLRIEGRLPADGGTFEGTFSQGPFEAPIVLHREPAAGEKTS